MTAYQPQWRNWAPNPHGDQTDKTDKSPPRSLKHPFVSFGGSSPGRFRRREEGPQPTHAHVAQENDSALREHAGCGWNAADWHALYDELVVIAEYVRGASREVAEATAFEVCVVRWLDSHPPSQDDLDCCVQCGQQIAEFDDIPCLTGDGGHVWIHGQCHPAWLEERRKQAVEALAGLGLSLGCTGAAK